MTTRIDSHLRFGLAGISDAPAGRTVVASSTEDYKTAIFSERDISMADLEILNPLLGQLSIRSKCVYEFFSSITRSDFDLDERLERLQSFGESVRTELANTSLLIVAGPMELPPFEMSFCVCELKEGFNPPLVEWQQIQAPDAVSSPSIPLQLLSVLGTTIKVDKALYGGITQKGKIYNALIRCTWLPHVS